MFYFRLKYFVLIEHIFSVSVFCSQIFILKLNLLPKIHLTSNFYKGRRQWPGHGWTTFLAEYGFGHITFFIFWAYHFFIFILFDFLLFRIVIKGRLISDN